MARHLAGKPQRRDPRNRRGGAGTIVVVLVLLVLGGTLLLAPSVSAVLDQLRVEEAVAGRRGLRSRRRRGAGWRRREGQPHLPGARCIQRGGPRGHGRWVNDPFAFSGTSSLQLGLPDGIVGSVDIPKMGVNSPLYLGATPSTLRAVRRSSPTSMPIGGASSNCVIAAHRGVERPSDVRDIELLEVGDTLTITTRWDTLTYRVIETRAIAPDDGGARRAGGRDLVTLFTCHPYGQHAALLVYCERVDNAGGTESAGLVDGVMRSVPPAGCVWRTRRR